MNLHQAADRETLASLARFFGLALLVAAVLGGAAGKVALWLLG